jgi:16S rRNA (cytidine1402-2'-O)-methyltransferase
VTSARQPTSAQPGLPGTLFVVATPIGNLEDITLRALRILREVRLIAAEDTRRTAQLLTRYDIHTPTTSFHEHSEKPKLTKLLMRLQQGENLAIVTDAGSPTISDPGQQLIRSALGAGIPVTSIPGPSAVIAALSVSGLEAGHFTFLGFPPIRSKDRKIWLQELQSAGRCVVFFEAPHRLRATITEIQREIGDCVVCVGRELTKAHEQLVNGQISQILDKLQTIKGEFTVVLEPMKTALHEVPVPTVQELVATFYQMTKYEALGRREAVRAVASKYGVSPNSVYSAIEAAKISGE